MPKEASVAPLERVNIVYKPSVKGKPEVELPLRLVALGDYTLRPDDRPLEERKPIEVDKDTFADVMKEQGLSLSVTVPDRLSGKPDQDRTIDLKIPGLDDFGPDSIVRQDKEAQKLLQLRDALKSLKGPLANVRNFRARLQGSLENDAEVEKLLSVLHEGGQEAAKDQPGGDQPPA